MEISSLLNGDLGHFNNDSLVQKIDIRSIYNTIYIFLKFSPSIWNKTRKYFPVKPTNQRTKEPKILFKIHFKIRILNFPWRSLLLALCSSIFWNFWQISGT